MWEQQSFHGTSLICKSLNRWPATSCKPVSVVHRFSFCTIDRGNCYSIHHCHEKYVPTGVLFDQIFKFRTLLEASSLEGYISFQYQTWNDGMTDVQRPPTLTLRSRTGAAKPTLWPTLNPCHFTVPCFIYKTKTFSFSSKQALSSNLFVVKSEEQQRFGGCSKSSTSGGRNLYARYGLAQSLVCAWPAWQRTWQRRFAPLHAPRQ